MKAESVLNTIGENPGQQSGTLSGVNEYTFNDLSLGNHSNVVWDNVGTFDELLINLVIMFLGHMTKTLALTQIFMEWSANLG